MQSFGLTWSLVEEARITPAWCTRCHSRIGTWASAADDTEIMSNSSWGWTCTSCNKMVSLTRSHIVRRYRAWLAA